MSRSVWSWRISSFVSQEIYLPHLDYLFSTSLEMEGRLCGVGEADGWDREIFSSFPFSIYYYYKPPDRPSLFSQLTWAVPWKWLPIFTPISHPPFGLHFGNEFHPFANPILTTYPRETCNFDSCTKREMTRSEFWLQLLYSVHVVFVHAENLIFFKSEISFFTLFAI